MTVLLFLTCAVDTVDVYFSLLSKEGLIYLTSRTEQLSDCDLNVSHSHAYVCLRGCIIIRQ